MAWDTKGQGPNALPEDLRSRTSPHIVGKSNFGMAQRNTQSKSTSGKAISFCKKDMLEPKLS